MDDIHTYAHAHHVVKKAPATTAPAPATSG
jgi:hypothetical protein